jgi:hypothetical protein
VVVVFPDLLDNKHLVPFLHELTSPRYAGEAVALTTTQHVA